MDDTIDTVIQNLDIGNTISACIALKEAAELLKNDEREMSDIILLMTKSLLERAMIQESEVEKTKNIVDSLKDNKNEQ